MNLVFYQCFFFSIMDTVEEYEGNLQQLFSNVEDYLAGTGICADITQYVSAIYDEAQRNGVFAVTDPPWSDDNLLTVMTSH